MSVNARDTNNQTALGMAVEREHDEVVKVLLASPRIDVNERGFLAFRPFHYALFKVKIILLHA